MKRATGSSPRASLSALPSPFELAAPASSRESAPISGDVSRDSSVARLERQRDELLSENAALKARLELLSSLGRAAWWDWDAKTERLTAHGDLVELVQLELPADLGTAGVGRWLDMLHPEDVRRARSAFLRSVSEPGEIAACPLRVRARGGGYRWVLVALTAGVETQRGHALRVFGAARDIHMERTSQEVAQRSAQVLESLLAGIVCADMNGVIGYANGVATGLLSHHGNCVGRSLFDLFPERSRDAWLELVAMASNGEAGRVEVQQGFGGATKRTWWLELTGYGDASGKPAGLVCVLDGGRAPQPTVR